VAAKPKRPAKSSLAATDDLAAFQQPETEQEAMNPIGNTTLNGRQGIQLLLSAGVAFFLATALFLLVEHRFGWLPALLAAASIAAIVLLATSLYRRMIAPPS
jgi:hypothetical protein